MKIELNRIEFEYNIYLFNSDENIFMTTIQYQKEKKVNKKINKNLPMNNRAFGESEKLITKRIDRNVTVIIHWVFCECAGYSLENGLAWIGQSFCTIASNNNTISRQILLIRIRLYKTALIRYISIGDFKPKIE